MELNSRKPDDKIEEATEAILAEDQIIPTIKDLAISDEKFLHNPNGNVSGNGGNNAGPSRTGSATAIVESKKSSTRI